MRILRFRNIDNSNHRRRCRNSGASLAVFLPVLLGILFAALPAAAHEHPEEPDTLRISLLTCWPGPDIYELCGHSAIRIQTPTTDSVWNYGVFDFNAPNFVYRFVKGETDYMLATKQTDHFLWPYFAQGRRVDEQVLALTPAEKSALQKRLRTEALPQNRVYRYNYVKDNCATRIAVRLDEVTGKNPVVYPDSVTYGTFRREMKAYHRDYPWYQFGIDVALGSGIDYPLTAREEMFVPVEMWKAMNGAHRLDGTPWVSESITLNPGMPRGATEPPTPWYLSPLFFGLVLLAVTAAISLYNIRRRELWKWYVALTLGVQGVAGIVITFLVFVSEHEATSPNILLLWLNPLPLVALCLMWWRKTRPLCHALLWVILIADLLMLGIAPFHPQSINIACYPLIISCAAVCALYLRLDSSAPVPTRHPKKKPVKRR